MSGPIPDDVKAIVEQFTCEYAPHLREIVQLDMALAIAADRERRSHAKGENTPAAGETVLVPREPTPEMIAAFAACAEKAGTTDADCFSAMLAAAPALAASSPVRTDAAGFFATRAGQHSLLHALAVLQDAGLISAGGPEWVESGYDEGQTVDIPPTVTEAGRKFLSEKAR